MIIKIIYFAFGACVGAWIACKFKAGMSNTDSNRELKDAVKRMLANLETKIDAVSEFSNENAGRCIANEKRMSSYEGSLRLVTKEILGVKTKLEQHLKNGED